VRRKDKGVEGQDPGELEATLSARKLPHNLEAEESVLGAILVDCSSAAGVFQLLTSEDFYSPRHAKVFTVFQTLYDRHATLDEVLVQEELGRVGLAESVGGMEFLDGLIRRVPTAANAEYYARIVREKAILRAIVGVAGDLAQAVFESDLPARDQLDMAEQKVFEIGKRSMGRDFVQISEVIDEHFEKIGKNQGEIEGTVYSGFHDVDALTTGYHPAEFIIVAGRPSMGKTSFCLNCVEHAALAGKRVGFFSLEVSRDQLVQNLLCAFSRVEAHRLRQRSLSRDMWQKLIDGAAKLSQTKIYIDDTPGLTPLSIKAKARRLHAREALDLIVIDYLQLMEVGGPGEPPAGNLGGVPESQVSGERAERSGDRREPAEPRRGEPGVPQAEAFGPARVRGHRAGCGPGAAPLPGRVLPP